MLDYEILKLIWWLLVGVLLLGFAVMDGHDMGVGTLLPFVGKTDEERRVVINTVGPHWDGNQVWFITAGGAVFAAWPLVYATAFSGFYIAMLAVLWALFFRPIGFDYRSKVADPRWRATWDWGLFAGGMVPSLVFGVAFGNVIQGVPFHYNPETMMVHYTGSFLALFNPFALVCGVVSLAMLTAHGGNYLAIRTEGEIQARAVKASLIFTAVMLAGFALAGVMVMGMSGYAITSAIDPAAAMNPLDKTVERAAGAWLGNFNSHPVLWLIPALGFIGGAASMALVKHKPVLAFVSSSAAMLGIIFTAGVAIFPFVLPSSSHLASSLTVWDCVSSHRTLNIMFWVALIMVPIILAYTAWAYRVMRGKVTVAYVKANDHSAY
jgi:cytochrome d ubiquinol oxidase subunit II